MNLIPKKLSHFQLSIDICISDTLDLTKKESDEFKQDYVDVILNVFIFKPNELIAKSYKKYKHSRKNPGHISDVYCCGEYDGPKIFFINGDFCCASGNDLVQLFQSEKILNTNIQKKQFLLNCTTMVF